MLPAEGAGSFTSSSTDVIDGTAQLLQPGFGAAGHQDEQRWVPYRHTNGVAIYHHKESAATCSLWSCGQVRRTTTVGSCRQQLASVNKRVPLAGEHAAPRPQSCWLVLSACALEQPAGVLPHGLLLTAHARHLCLLCCPSLGLFLLHLCRMRMLVVRRQGVSTWPVPLCAVALTSASLCWWTSAATPPSWGLPARSSCWKTGRSGRCVLAQAVGLCWPDTF